MGGRDRSGGPARGGGAPGPAGEGRGRAPAGRGGSPPRRRGGDRRAGVRVHPGVPAGRRPRSMMDLRRELARQEDERWAELRAVLDRLSPSQMLVPGLTEDWTVKDLLAHLGSWMAEAVVVLAQIRA